LEYRGYQGGSDVGHPLYAYGAILSKALAALKNTQYQPITCMLKQRNSANSFKWLKNHAYTIN
jgi:hypothetical protein